MIEQDQLEYDKENNYKSQFLSLLCETASKDDILLDDTKNNIIDNDDIDYINLINYNKRVFSNNNNNNNNLTVETEEKKNNLLLLKQVPSTPSTPSTPLSSRSLSPVNITGSKNYTEYDADLNIFNSDNESIENKNKNLLERLLSTVKVMSEEIEKKDELIKSIENENNILNDRLRKVENENNNNNSISKSSNDNYEKRQIIDEMNKLKKQVDLEKSQNYLLKNKIKQLEDNVDLFSIQSTTEYKDLINNNSSNDVKTIEQLKLDKDNLLNEMNTIVTTTNEEKRLLHEQIKILKQKLINIGNSNSNNNKADNLDHNKLIVKNEIYLHEIEEFKKLTIQLKAENEKLIKQVKLFEKQEFLESEITETFHSILKQKCQLENENKSLLTKLNQYEDIIKEFKNNEVYLKILNDKDFLNKNTSNKKFLNEFNELKEKYSKLQVELAEKYSEIDVLNTERSSMLKALNTIQQDKQIIEQAISKQSNKQILQLEESYNKLKNENQLLQNKLETFSQLNCEQQLNIKNLLNDIEQKNIQIEKLQSKKIDETKRIKQQTQLHQDKLKYQQSKYESEIDELKKKHIKEFEQIKFNNEQSITRNGELSRTNLELRKKLQSCDDQIKDLNDKLLSQKQQLDLQIKQKKELKEEYDRKEFSLKKDLNILELMRDEYLRKNETQQKSVEQMIEQINTFQNEINNLIQYNKNLNESLKKFKLNYEVYKKKYTELKLFIKQNDNQQQYQNGGIDLLNTSDSGYFKVKNDDFVYLTPTSSAASRSIPTYLFQNETNNQWLDMKLYEPDKLQ